MAEPKPIVIDSFQRGIADSPLLGFQDIRNLEIVGTPGVASLSFRLEAMNQPPAVSALAYTTDTAADTLTVSDTTGWYDGMAITLDTVVTSTGISTGRVYWVGDLSGNTFRLYKNPSLPSAQLVDIGGSNGSGTLSSYTLGKPIDRAWLNTFTSSIFRPYAFVLDENGRVWWVKNVENGTPGLTSDLVYLGNDTLTAASGRALCVFSQDLVVFRYDSVDVLQLSAIENTAVDFDGLGGWSYAEETIASTQEPVRAVLAGTDGLLYYAADNAVGSLTDSYVDNSPALDLSNDTVVTSLGELGLNLLVGTKGNLVYPWDRESSSFSLPLAIPESGVGRILTANNIAYLFAGNTGHIYWTNGSSVARFRKVPDHVAGVSQPYFEWGDAMAWRNQILFSFTASENDGTALSATAGVWAIDTATGALRQLAQPSHGTNAGSVTVLLPNVLSSSPSGDGIYAGWANGSTYGMDASSTQRHQSYSGHAISQLFTIGTAWSPRRLSKAYLELARPLASGQGVKVYFRTSLSDSWTLMATCVNRPGFSGGHFV